MSTIYEEIIHKILVVQLPYKHSSGKIFICTRQSQPRNFYNETSSSFNSLWIVEIVSLFCRFSLLVRFVVHRFSSFMELRLAIHKCFDVTKCRNHFYFSIGTHFFAVFLAAKFFVCIAIQFRLKLEERCIVEEEYACLSLMSDCKPNKSCH